MLEPAGSSMVTSMDPEGPKYWLLAAGASIRKMPSTYPTVACCAAFTSRPFDALTGWTWTVVSVRSAARNRMSPAGISRTAVIGAGVSNVCMVLSYACMLPILRNATLHSEIRQPSRCILDALVQINGEKSLQWYES